LVQPKYRVEPRGSSPPPSPPLCLYIVSSFAVCNDVIDFSISHQVEFMVEDEMVEIVPNMNMEFHRCNLSTALQNLETSGTEEERQMHFPPSSVVVCCKGNCLYIAVNLVRPFVRRALEAFYKHDKPEAYADRDTRSSSRQPREANNEPRGPLKAALRSFKIFAELPGN
ncbi:hypothetical protein DY000_02043327, partial [Brassica cretica]